MYPLRKLGELPPKTRCRKIVLILEKLEHDCAMAVSTGDATGMAACAAEEYFLELVEVLSKDPGLSQLVTADATAAKIPLIRRVNTLRHALVSHLGLAPAEWDFIQPDTGLLDASQRQVHPLYVYMEDIRSPYNVGSIMRSAEAFGVTMVFMSPRTPRPDHPRASRSGRGAEKILRWETCTLEEAIQTAATGDRKPFPVFALETGGTPMREFSFPARGLVIIGSEELGVGDCALEIADASRGRVTIPMAGAKRSLNVAVSFGILMQSWFDVLMRA